MAWLSQQDSVSAAEEPDDALHHAELERYFEHLERTPIAIEFHDPAQPRQLMARLSSIPTRSP